MGEFQRGRDIAQSKFILILFDKQLSSRCGYQPINFEISRST